MKKTPEKEAAQTAKTYRVSAQVTISISTVVEAHSPAQAKRLAAERRMVDLCWQCAEGNADEEWVTSGELDGSPQKLAVEEA